MTRWLHISSRQGPSPGPGLMKMSNHHHEHQALPQEGQHGVNMVSSMTKCVTLTMSGCHMNSCMLRLAGLNKAG